MYAWEQSGSAAAALTLVLVTVAGAAPQDGPRLDRRQRERLAQNQRLEGQAMLALADAAMRPTQALNSRAGAPDLRLRWKNDFLKAQHGTFVPFTLVIDSASALPRSALVYVRAVPRRLPSAAHTGPSTRKAPGGPLPAGDYPVDAMFPVDLEPDASGVARVSRGFSVAPGDYDVVVVVRERTTVPAAASRAQPRAAVVAERLFVPDFWTGELTTSSIILADHLANLGRPLTDEELVERPYAIGSNEIRPATDDTFRRDEELVVVFLVYNPAVSPGKRFDIDVQYHFYRRGPRNPAAAPSTGSHPRTRGRADFNHTEPQRFTPAVMGAQFDPGAGHPILAGQGVPLSGFEVGDYRLEIRVTDLLSRKLVVREVLFRVQGS